jgi:hypothetical protein
MTTDLWMTQWWTDYRLTWNPAEFNNVTNFLIPANMIWVPKKTTLSIQNNNLKHYFNYQTDPIASRHDNPQYVGFVEHN